MNDLADRIRRARRIRGMSQARLAKYLGVTTSAVGHWERPEGHRPSLENLVEIAKHLSVSIEWLALGRREVHLSGSHEPNLGVVSLSYDEQLLLEQYRAIPTISRMLLMQLLDVLKASPEMLTAPGAFKIN